MIALADDGGWLALFRIGDELRPEAVDLVIDLKAAGCAVSLLTGDAPSVAARVGRQLGIDDIRAGMSPQGSMRTFAICRITAGWWRWSATE